MAEVWGNSFCTYLAVAIRLIVVLILSYHTEPVYLTNIDKDNQARIHVEL